MLIHYLNIVLKGVLIREPVYCELYNFQLSFNCYISRGCVTKTIELFSLRRHERTSHIMKLAKNPLGL